MHKLLQRQVQKHFKDLPIPECLIGLLEVISSSYEHYNQDRLMLERSIEISSLEMMELNKSEKQAHEELQKLYESVVESENKFRNLFEKMADGVYKSSHEGRFIEVNPALVTILGYETKEELLALDIKSQLYFEKEDRDEAIQYDRDNGNSVFKLKKKDGSAIWVEDRGQYISDEKGNILYHEGILRDVTERVKSQVAILEANNKLKKSIEHLAKTQQQLKINIAELQKTNSELDKFVYSVSHDLRAPLCSMLGVIEIARFDTVEEITIEHLDMLTGNIKKLDGFISDILAYSRNSRMEVRQEKINFRELLGDITHNLKYMGNMNRPVDFKIEITNEDSVYCDKSRLNIILNNLISNAIRYQNSQVENPFVGIKVDVSDTETGIIVNDNGIGIKKELHDKIFDMFYRVSEESVGSGLGLYLVKEAVSKLNGSIKVHSDPGIGSTFIINIPIS